jgi:hypothetical protein
MSAFGPASPVSASSDMATSQLVDQIIRSGPLATLEQNGFLQKGRVFYIYRGEVFQFVHFFSSRWTRADVAVFTLSVGVTVRYLHSGPLPPERMITNIAPLVGHRFGPDVDHPVGQFWFAHSIEPAATEVIERIEKYALPWLLQFATETALASYLLDCRTGMNLSKVCSLARILARTGMEEQVPEVMERAQAELERLKPNSRMDQWQLWRSMVAETEEWIKQEQPAE